MRREPSAMVLLVTWIVMGCDPGAQTAGRTPASVVSPTNVGTNGWVGRHQTLRIGNIDFSASALATAGVDTATLNVLDNTAVTGIERFMAGDKALRILRTNYQALGSSPPPNIAMAAEVNRGGLHSAIRTELNSRGYNLSLYQVEQLDPDFVDDLGRGLTQRLTEAGEAALNYALTTELRKQRPTP